MDTGCTHGTVGGGAARGHPDLAPKGRHHIPHRSPGRPWDIERVRGSSGVILRRKTGSRHTAGKGRECPKGGGKKQKIMWKLMESSKKPWEDMVGVVEKI